MLIAAALYSTSAKAAMVASGGSHSCAIVRSGSVLCWGANASGQLGNGSTTASPRPVVVPTFIPETLDVTAVAAGSAHSCALVLDGSVRCWGENGSGQLGNGLTSDSASPVVASGVSNAVQIAAGLDFTCALSADGSAKCWGEGSAGQLGDGTAADSLSPVTVSGLINASGLSVGDGHACVQASGSVRCWGANGFGQLGDGSTAPANSPVVVGGVSGATQVAAGATHSCAVTATNVKCWGANASGQLGDGTTTSPRTTAVTVGGLTSPSKVTAGSAHTCATDATPAVKCWGAGASGQLGNGANSQSSTPVAASVLTAANSLSASASHSCALSSDSSIYCWGDGATGQIGDGATSSRNSPSTVVNTAGGKLAATGSSHSCIALSGGKVNCWGTNGKGQVGDASLATASSPVVAYNLFNLISISAGSAHSCAVEVGGQGKCWGDNQFGQVGAGTATSYYNMATNVSGLTNAVTVDNGANFSCALTTAATAKCWGQNGNYQLGDTTTTTRTAPVTVSGLSNVIAVTAGGTTSCAIVSGGQAKCWGNNAAGQVGQGNTTTPVTAPVNVSGLTNATAIANGPTHSCALLADTTVKCWGANDYGQTGDGTTTTPRTSPVVVSGLVGVTAIAVGDYHSCAIAALGVVKCWGYGANGRLGNSGTANSSTPVNVTAMLGAISLSLGGQHACAVKASGKTYCWGYGLSNQLGNGSTADRTAPFESEKVLEGLITIPTPLEGAFVQSTLPSIDYSTIDVISPLVECNLDGTGFSSCSFPPYTPGSPLAIGRHTMQIRAAPNFGGNDVISYTNLSFAISVVLPTATITTPAEAAVTNDNTPSMSFLATGEGALTTDCRADSESWVTCSTGWSSGTLADGAHTLQLRVTDANTNAATATVNITVDTTAPNTTITASPASISNTGSPSFSFTSSEAGGTLQCRLDLGSWNTCSSPNNLSGVPNGAHTFDVRAIDPAGNVDASPASHSWTVDTTPPNTSITANPASSTSSADASFSFSASEAATFQCQLDGGGYSACTSPRNYSALADGAHTFMVRATDTAGNLDATPANYAWTIDATPPDTTITANPATVTTSTGATFNFTASESSTYQCRLDAGGYSACTSPRNYSALAAGSHTFMVRATDTAGNVDLSPASFTWTIDLTPPDTSITANPAAIASSSGASFSFSASETATFQCQLDAGGYSACTSPHVYSSLADGAHTFMVRATDTAGNLDATPAGYAWTVDTVSPDTSIDGSPLSLTTSSAASFGFSATETSSFECKLDAGAWTVCVSPKSYLSLADGPHTFSVRALDAAGNIDASPATYGWTIDATAPDTTITASPPLSTISSAAAFSFSASETATFQCQLDGGGYSACTSPRNYSSLGEGSHTFMVRATDTAGNLDATPAMYAWSVDTVAPDTSITANPASLANSSSATFSFSASETSTYQCQLDGGGYSACTSPRNYSALADGAHTFMVRATDTAGNLDATPASYAWTIDATAPNTSITANPASLSASTSAAFSFSASETSTYQCQLDGGGYSACTSPRNYSALADGAHTFMVRATDTAGNLDATPASYAWTIDATAPNTSITANPASLSASTSATFSFSASETSTYQCQLDAGGYSACTSPRNYSALADGAHTFMVRATDTAGNTDATPASYAWTIDATAPNTSITANPATLSASTSAVFSFSASETATFQCQLDGGGYSACTSPRNYSALADGAHTFMVRATDTAGNLDATPASYAWTIDATAPNTSITANPASLSASTSAAFSFSASETSTYQCQLDGGGYSACTSPRNYSALADGAHTFMVRATDTAGNLDATPASYAWTIDSTVPSVLITSPADGVTTGDSTPTIGFTASDANGVAVECRIDGGSWTSCGSPHTTATLADGAHTFQLRATDPAGNQGTASINLTVDSTFPTISITSPVDGAATADSTPAVTFSAAGSGGTTTECRVDSGSFGACVSGDALGALADGPHTVTARVTDGLARVATADRTFIVDTAAPMVNFSSPGNGSTVADPTVDVSFAVTDATAVNATCKVDAGVAVACNSPFSTPALADGAHSVTVDMIDAAGNTGSGSIGFTIDQIDPIVTINSPADAATVTTASVSVVFSATDASAVSHECSVNGGVYQPCVSPYSPTLAAGAHSVSVRSTDLANNTATDTVSFSFSPPVPPPSGPPSTSPATGSQTYAAALAAKKKGAKLTLTLTLRPPAGIAAACAGSVSFNGKLVKTKVKGSAILKPLSATCVATRVVKVKKSLKGKLKLTGNFSGSAQISAVKLTKTFKVK